MKVTIESTDEIFMINGQRARRWVGVSAKGVEFDAFIVAFALSSEDDHSEFEDAISEMVVCEEHRAPDRRH